jgi:phosphoglycolate phosphatase
MAERNLLLFELDGVLATRTPSGELTRTPGSWEALSQFQYRSDAVSSVVTRTAREEALAKLGEVTGIGLDRYCDPEVGAYGEDAGEPGGLVAVARRRASERYGCDFAVTAVTEGSLRAVSNVAGQVDTVVAVAADGALAEELRAAGATHVIAGLGELVPLVLGANVS